MQSGFDCVCRGFSTDCWFTFEHTAATTESIQNPSCVETLVLTSPLSRREYFQTGRCIRQQVGSPLPVAGEFIFVSVSRHFWYIPHGIT